MAVGRNIKLQREKLEMTVETLAAKTGIDPVTLERYENEDVEQLPLMRMVKLAKALQCRTEDLSGQEYSSAEPIQIDNGMITDQEYQLICRYRKLPKQAQKVVDEICSWEIYVKNRFYSESEQS
jgi:transcriptional regulator with XRE-family HTH domain